MIISQKLSSAINNIDIGKLIGKNGIWLMH